MSDWQRLDQIVTALASAASWRQAIDGAQAALAPEATIYRLTHRGRKLSGPTPTDNFWIAHHPALRQMLQDQEPGQIDEGPASGEWRPWRGGALRVRVDADRRWLQAVVNLLNHWPAARPVTEQPVDAIKALHQLNELSWVIHRTVDLAEFLQRVPEAVGRHLEATHCALIQFRADEEIGRVLAAWEQGREHPGWAELSFSRTSPLGQSLHVAPTGRWRPDPRVLPELTGSRTAQLFCDTDTLIAPMHDGSQRTGMLVVRHPSPRSHRLIRLLAAIAEQVAAGLQLRLHHFAEKRQSEISQAIYKGAPTALILLDGDGALLSANDAAIKLLGPIPAGPFPLYRLLSGVDRQRLTEAWLDLEGGRTVVIDHAHFHRLDGTGLELGYRLNPIGNVHGPGSPAVVMSLQDQIGPGSRMQELEETILRWQSLGAELPQAVAIVDSAHQLVWANAVPPPISNGRATCCHPLFADPVGGACLASQALGEGLTRTVIHQTASDPLSVRIWPVTDRSGSVIGAVALHQPAPARGAGADAERWALLGRLVPPVRHELNNPLGVIHGRLEALRLDGLASPHLAAIERAADRLGAIVKELGEWQVRPGEAELLDVGECARTTLSTLASPLQAQGLRWELQLANEPLLIWGVQEDMRLLLAHVLLAPGRQRPLRELTMRLGATAGWAEIHLEGWQVVGAEWLGEALLKGVGGRWATHSSSPTPCLQLPRWLGRPSVQSPA